MTVHDAVSKAYPEHNWEPFKFSVGSQFWEKYLAENKEEYVKYLEKEWNITKEEDWKTIQKDDLKRVKTPSRWK